MSKPRPTGAASGAPARAGNNLRGRAGPPASGPSYPASAAAPASASAAARRPAASSVASSSSSRASGEDGLQAQGLKLVNGDQEFSILDNKVTIGRRKECDVCLADDPLVSGNHCEITNGFALDSGSTNGTTLNGVALKQGVKKMLKAGDKLQIGDRILRIEVGAPRSAEDGGQDLSRSKKFMGGIGSKDKDGKDSSKDKSDDSASSSSSSQKESDEDAKLTVEELMDKEFAKIIGHDGLKKQLRQFYKKVQLDQIRIKAGKEKDAKRLYHMIFSGPPGTGQCSTAQRSAGAAAAREDTKQRRGSDDAATSGRQENSCERLQRVPCSCLSLLLTSLSFVCLALLSLRCCFPAASIQGKTTMANLVSKIMLKMKLVSSDKVVFVNNALELLGSYVGQTPAKVDAKVAEAKGGIMFIDEAYSIVKGGGDRDSNGGQFGREAIDTIMKVRDKHERKQRRQPR